MNSQTTAEQWKKLRAQATALLYDDHGNRIGKDVDYIQDPETGRFEGSRPQGGGEGSRTEGRGRARSGEQAQSRAEKAAAGHAKLVGLPDKPLKVGDSWYVPGPFGKAKEAADSYMRSAGLSYDPPKQFLKVDKGRAARVANEYDTMKHDPDDPKVRASYDALAKETLAQWQEIKKTGLKVEWTKPGQDDPYATTPRLGAMDVTENNHWWGFPTDLGYGTDDPTERHNNPMLQETDEVVDGRRLVVNDVFRIVHDYFGHFKEGVGFRADGEENAWRSHAAMYSELARGAMTSETRGQNSWVNYGPYGEKNRTASAGDTIYAPQKVGLMPEWTWNEARGDPKEKQWQQLRARAEALLRDFDESKHPRDDRGRFAGGGGADGDGASGGGPPVVAFHGTIEPVVDRIMEEGLRVTPGGRHFEGDVYAGERGESVFVTTNQQTAITYASSYAQSESWHAYKAIAPVMFRLEIPQDEWRKFNEDKLEPESRYTRAIPPEWITGAYKITGSDELEKIRAALGLVTAYMVVFVGEPKAKSWTRDWDESKHPRVPAGSSEGGQFGEGGGGGTDEAAAAEAAALDPKVVEVGGDAWNKATARRLEREYQAARKEIEKLLEDSVGKSAAPKVVTTADWTELTPEAQDAVYQAWVNENISQFKDRVEAADFWDGMSDEERAKLAVKQGVTVEGQESEDESDEPYVPEEWDMLSASGQSDVEEKYYSDNEQSMLDSEIENWQSENAPDDARAKVAEDFNDGKEQEWAEEALDDMREWMEKEGKKEIPFDDDTLIEAITINYESGYGGGSYWKKDKDKIISIDDKVLRESKADTGEQGTFPGIEPEDFSKLLTDEMRGDIRTFFVDRLDDAADKIAGDMEPPDYLSESAKESMEMMWSEMSDDQKFEYAKDNTDVVENETTGEKLELVDPPSGKYTGTIKALPKTFDPLNKTSGSDYRQTQAVAKFLSVERTAQVLEARGITKKILSETGGTETGLKSRIATTDAALWSSWKSSSTSQNGILLQVATAEELGGRLNLNTHPDVIINPIATRNWADEHYKSLGGYEGIKAYVRAKWETTQYLLDQADQQELELFRGIDMKRYSPARYEQAVKEKGVKFRQVVIGERGDAKVRFEKVPTAKIDRNGAASATTDITVANDWKRNSEGAVVLRAHIPRTAAISIPAYGINVHSEHEVVVAGVAWKQWDAWLGKAPPFDVVPMTSGVSGIGTNAPRLAA